MSRQSLDQRPYVFGAATFDPAGTGSQKVHKLVLPLTYRGDAKGSLFDFLTTVESASVQAKFALDGQKSAKAPDEAGWLAVVGKFQKTVLSTPRTREEKPSVLLTFIVLGQDVRMIGEQ